jgi:hypothetical protein
VRSKSGAIAKEIPTVSESVPKIQTLKVTDALQLLTDQNKGQWAFCGPAGHLARLMREKMGAAYGLPSDGPALIAWLQLKEHRTAVRDARVLVSFVNHPRSPSSRRGDPNLDPADFPPMIRLAKQIHPDQFVHDEWQPDPAALLVKAKQAAAAAAAKKVKEQ